MKASIVMQMIMSIVKLPSIRHYWQGSLRYPGVADVMPRNRFEALRRFIHFVDNSSVHAETNKLLKIQPIIDAVRRRCIMIEPEEYHSNDEQIVPSKTKFIKLDSTTQKSPTNGILNSWYEMEQVVRCTTFLFILEMMGITMNLTATYRNLLRW